MPHHVRVPDVQMDPKSVSKTSAAHPTTPHGLHSSQDIRERAAEAPLKCPWMPPRGQVENFWAEKRGDRILGMKDFNRCFENEYWLFSAMPRSIGQLFFPRLLLSPPHHLSTARPCIVPTAQPPWWHWGQRLCFVFATLSVSPCLALPGGTKPNSPAAAPALPGGFPSPKSSPAAGPMGWGHPWVG